VPQGKSIHFDKKTQSFEIPENTRFYKTFLKHIVDSDGQERYKKIETRLIVTRPDAGLGVGQSRALFGSYKWNAAETEATLQNAIDQPLHNGEAFADELLTYITDEPAAQAIRDKNPANLTFEYERAKVIRHYAIPGRDRCIQCHMGSPSQDFVLGFTPLQLVRRPMDEGGIFEPAEGEELTQLDRLSALGVITGIDSVADIVPLEQTQGTRAPRNARELTAQGYLLGNCAHCHNPRGYPTQVAPELKVLNFYPGMKDTEGKGIGGIFQFPLTLASPRVTRGLDARPVPYITPSLRDLIPYNYQDRIADGSYTPKWEEFTNETEGTTTRTFFEAPWRSLIFRNVHNPFAYGDDYTIFPHMPMNTAGYDCRARQLLGNWMVSIPARRKHAEIKEDFVPRFNTLGNGGDAKTADNESQPYVEALASDADYQAALDAAAVRLAKFQAGPEYKCPDTSDILDPAVGKEKGDQGTLVITPRDKLVPLDGVPDRTHWVSTDLTAPNVEWEPRQTTWERVLVHQDYPEVEAGNAVKLQQREEEKKVVAILSTVTPNEQFKKFALAPFPMALWKQKSECQTRLAAGSVAKAGSFTGSKRLRWLDISKVANDAPLYQALPGGAIYDMVCVNCHGRKFDAQGRQAETVQLMTGGEARVANFVTGLFGPLDSPGANRARVFGKVATTGVSADDWGARYMAWMALGGTDKTIPQAVLQIVSRTDVSGTRRLNPLLLDASANMLAAGKAACEFVLPIKDHEVVSSTTDANHYALAQNFNALITGNGDAELWQRTCSLGNRPVIRAFAGASSFRTGGPANLYKPDKYPAGAAVGNHLGATVKWGDPEDNYFPWCVRPPFTQPDPPAAPLPVCPEAMLATDAYNAEELEDWARRGAINAGMAVFLYMDQVARGKFDPLRYDECEKLPSP
jgi:mono/diheme cytochrome c family protein